MILLLMAAGRGSRYGKLKQFDGFGPNEEFLMEYSMYDAIENGFEHIVVITQKDNVSFLKEYLGGRLPENIKLDVISQELSDLPSGVNFTGTREKPWGTAHAVWSARNVIRTPFAVINADDYYGKAAYKNASGFIDENVDDHTYGLLAYTLNDTLSEYGSVSRGVCQSEGDSLISVNERTKIEKQDTRIIDLDSGIEFDGSELVSMNFWVCMPSIFDHIASDLRNFINQEDTSKIETGEVYLPFVMQEMLRDKSAKVKVIPSDSKWFGITYADDKQKAVDLLEEMTTLGSYPAPLWDKPSS